MIHRPRNSWVRVLFRFVAVSVAIFCTCHVLRPLPSFALSPVRGTLLGGLATLPQRPFCCISDALNSGSRGGFRWMLQHCPPAGNQRRRARQPDQVDDGSATNVAALKQLLLEHAAEFKAAQEELWNTSVALSNLPQKKGSNQNVAGAAPLEAESLGATETQLTSDLELLKKGIVGTIDSLAACNPTTQPLEGWCGFGGEDPSRCGLDGVWKLVWTNAADATFKPGKQGSATAFQLIDAEKGTFTNAVNFDGSGKLRGFRVVVAGVALSASEMQLIFKRAVLLRRSRFPWLFRRLVIPFPNPGFLRWLGRILSRGKANQSRRGAGFTILYLDDDLRMHRTFDGLYFVQQRLKAEPPLPA